MTGLWDGRLSSSFDRWAASYEDDVLPKFTRRGHSYGELAARIAEHGSIRDGDAVLELGVGTGLVGEHLAAHRPLGLDISPGMLEAAAAKDCYRHLLLHTAQHLPFPAASFDVVYTCFMVHSLRRPRQALADYARVLRPGGRLVLVDLFRTAPRVPVWSFVVDNVHSLRHEKLAVSNYRSRSEVRAMMAGPFEVVHDDTLDATDDVARHSAGGMQHGMLVGVTRGQSAPVRPAGAGRGAR